MYLLATRVRAVLGFSKSVWCVRTPAFNKSVIYRVEKQLFSRLCGGMRRSTRNGSTLGYTLPVVRSRTNPEMAVDDDSSGYRKMICGVCLKMGKRNPRKYLE